MSPLWRRRPKAVLGATALGVVAAGALLHHLGQPAAAVPPPLPPAALAPPPPPPPPWIRSGERGRGHGGPWADPPPPPPAVAPRAHERLRLVSWNMGSLDNSPFAHWRGQGKSVLALMTAAHAVLLDPARDVRVRGRGRGRAGVRVRVRGRVRDVRARGRVRVRARVSVRVHPNPNPNANPKQARDVRVGEIFTDSMWAELREEMRALGWVGINETDALWRTELSHRPAYQVRVRVRVSQP